MYNFAICRCLGVCTGLVSGEEFNPQQNRKTDKMLKEYKNFYSTQSKFDEKEAEYFFYLASAVNNADANGCLIQALLHQGLNWVCYMDAFLKNTSDRNAIQIACGFPLGIEVDFENKFGEIRNHPESLKYLDFQREEEVLNAKKKDFKEFYLIISPETQRRMVHFISALLYFRTEETQKASGPDGIDSSVPSQIFQIFLGMPESLSIHFWGYFVHCLRDMPE